MFVASPGSMRIANLFLAYLVLAGCSSKSTPTGGCPQPPQPTCVARTTAWCAAATFLACAEALGDAGPLVTCPDLAGNRFTVFDSGGLDDAGLPYGCPSLSITPDYLSVLDAGMQIGSSCCYPTGVFCQ